MCMSHTERIMQHPRLLCLRVFSLEKTIVLLGKLSFRAICLRVNDMFIYVSCRAVLSLGQQWSTWRFSATANRRYICSLSHDVAVIR